jgi:hypothetical protein
MPAFSLSAWLTDHFPVLRRRLEDSGPWPGRWMNPNPLPGEQQRLYAESVVLSSTVHSGPNMARAASAEDRVTPVTWGEFRLLAIVGQRGHYVEHGNGVD